MSDTTPILDDVDTCSAESSENIAIRARILLNNGTISNICDSDEKILKHEVTSSNNIKCCKKNSEHKKLSKYAITFVAATWGFLTNVERAIILPTIWLYLGTWSSSAASTYYGPTLGAFSLSILLATPLFGCAAQAKFSVRVLLIMANTFEIIGNIVYLIANKPYLVLLGRLIAGIGASCESPMYADLIRSTDAEERTSFIIILLLSRQVGLIVGPVCTLIISRLSLHIGTFNITVYNGPGFVMAFFWILHSLLIIFFYPTIDKSFDTSSFISSDSNTTFNNDESKNKRSSALPSSFNLSFSGCWTYLQYTSVAIYIIIFTAYFCSMGLEAVLSPVSNSHFRWNEVQLSYAYIGASFLVILSAVLMHFLSKHYEDRKLLLCGLLLLFLSYSFIACILSLLSYFTVDLAALLFVGGLAIHVIAIPFPLALSESLYSKLMPISQSDQAQTIIRTIINIAYLVGPLIGGILQSKPVIVFLLMFYLVTMSILILIFRFSLFKVGNSFTTQNDLSEPHVSQC